MLISPTVCEHVCERSEVTVIWSEINAGVCILTTCVLNIPLGGY